MALEVRKAEMQRLLQNKKIAKAKKHTLKTSREVIPLLASAAIHGKIM
jgi:hypothetical protein